MYGLRWGGGFIIKIDDGVHTSSGGNWGRRGRTRYISSCAGLCIRVLITAEYITLLGLCRNRRRYTTAGYITRLLGYFLSEYLYKPASPDILFRAIWDWPRNRRPI